LILWLCAIAASLILLGLVAVFVPVSLSCNAQGRAEPSGAWALAFGMGIGPLALSVLAAANVAPFVTCHLFGKQILRIPLSRLSWATKSVDESHTRELAPRLGRATRRFLQRLDPVDVLLEWWEKERVFEVRSLVVDLEYSFQDVALTGRILAALYVLSGVLPESVEINQTPAWDAEDRVALAADGKFRIWPGRLLVYGAQFVLKHRVRAEPSALTASH
jgi:hypothetical protein